MRELGEFQGERKEKAMLEDGNGNGKMFGREIGEGKEGKTRKGVKTRG